MRTQEEVDKLLQKTMREIGRWQERFTQSESRPNRKQRMQRCEDVLAELNRRAALLRWFSGEDTEELSR
ncbi:MAG: hypothetical protein WC742_15430 [Gallionellaceae bacterium]|jgi:hypothetical protein